MSEKGPSGFRKTAPMLFYRKVRDAPPLVFIPRTPQVVLGPLYLHGGGVPGRLVFCGVPDTSFPVAPHGEDYFQKSKEDKKMCA